MTNRLLMDEDQSQGDTHRLVDFGEEGAGVYQKKYCIRESEETCDIKFGYKYYSGNIVYRGNYTECREKGIECGFFARGDATPRGKFTYPKSQDKTRSSVAHDDLVKTMAESNNLNVIDEMLSSDLHGVNNGQKRKQPDPATKLTITKKSKQHESVDQRNEVSKVAKDTTLMNKTNVSQMPFKKRLLPAPQGETIEDITNDDENTLIPRISASPMTFDQVKTLLKEQDDRWARRFQQLETEHKVLKKELKKAKENKTMMVNGQDLMLFSAESDLAYCMKIVPIIVPDIFSKCFSK